MQKTILITGSTDGIGLETAKSLFAMGHHVLLHGRNPEKLERAERNLSALPGDGRVESFIADMSRFSDVVRFANTLIAQHSSIDVLINNAGIYKTADTITPDALDVRFAVNTISPYLLTQRLLPLLGATSRVINLSSAAQSPVDLDAMAGRISLKDDFEAYAQSKLALTMWSHHMADQLKDQGINVLAVNPGSLLGTKMVKEGFGLAGKDIGIGADILVQLALEDEFRHITGQYFDNDSGQLSSPHPDALDNKKNEALVLVIEETLSRCTDSNPDH